MCRRREVRGLRTAKPRKGPSLRRESVGGDVPVALSQRLSSLVYCSCSGSVRYPGWPLKGYRRRLELLWQS